MNTYQTTTSINQPTDAIWAVRQWARFWANPDVRGDTSVLAADIIGRWPDGRVLRGIEDYLGRLVTLGTVIPDIRLDMLEHAVNDDLAFIRWRGHGTGPNGPFELFGADRLRVEGDKIKENIVLFDTATFEAVVGIPLSAT